MSEKEFDNVIPETEENNEENTAAAEENDVIEEAAEVIAEEAAANAEVIADEFSEETAEAAEEVIDEALEEVEETADELVEASDGFIDEEAAEEVVEEIKKKSKAPIVTAIVVVLIAAAAVIYFVFGVDIGGNKYNKLGYVNPSGNTVADVAEQLGMTVPEFLEQFGLPADMPEDTTEMAAFYTMPLKNMAAMYGVDTATMKEQLKIPDETTVSEPDTIWEKIKSVFAPEKPQPIDDNTPWGLVEDEITLGNYYGEEYLAEFKEFYGLGDEVTADTKYKEVRDAVNQKTLELMAEQEAQLEEEQDLADADDSEADTAEETDGDVESETDADNQTEEQDAE